MINKRKISVLLTFAAVLLSCSKELPIYYLGEIVTATVNTPEESQDLEFIWEITSIPDKSSLKSKDIQAGNDDLSIIFIPDSPGIYNIEVSIFQYNDEISTQQFSYNILEIEQPETVLSKSLNTKNINSDTLDISELITENNEDEDWFNSKIAKEIVNSSNPELITAKIPKIKTDLKKKSSITLKKKKKQLKTRGSSIQFNKNRFTIQIGSKRELEDANKVAAKLIDDGYDAYIQKAFFKNTDEVWYRIRVGSYDKRETASAVAQSLSKSRPEKAWVDFVRYEE